MIATYYFNLSLSYLIYNYHSFSISNRDHVKLNLNVLLECKVNLSINKFHSKKKQQLLVGSTHRKGSQAIRVDRREWRVEDLKELKDSSFRMYDICAKKK